MPSRVMPFPLLRCWMAILLNACLQVVLMRFDDSIWQEFMHDTEIQVCRVQGPDVSRLLNR